MPTMRTAVTRLALALAMTAAIVLAAAGPAEAAKRHHKHRHWHGHGHGSVVKLWRGYGDRGRARGLAVRSRCTLETFVVDGTAYRRLTCPATALARRPRQAWSYQSFHRRSPFAQSRAFGSHLRPSPTLPTIQWGY